MTTWRPERKIVAGGGFGLPLAVIIAWAWGAAMPEAKMPAEVSAALGAVLTTLFSYLIPNPK